MKNDWVTLRKEMVTRQIRARGVADPRVLAAMTKVERHLFVEEDLQSEAYDDHPLAIGQGQTISQPYMVAYMSEVLQLSPQDRVLEIGAGCGYQTAILAELVQEVYSLEMLAPLAETAQQRLASLGYQNVQIRQGDGFYGWEEASPFAAILVAAAAPRMPQALLDQLQPGGRLVIPLGVWQQQLQLYTKKPEGGFLKRHLLSVRFVPLMGRVQTMG